MSVRLKIGLTGGIGSGKTAALAEFRAAGAETLCADETARELSRPGAVLHRAIGRIFGKNGFAADGTVDRRFVADKVFKNPRLRSRLEKAAHPAIRRELRRREKAARGPVLIVSVPLLFENGLERDYDLSLLVTAKKSIRLKRILKRDAVSRAHALLRMRAQMPEDAKSSRADLVLRNDGSRAGFKRSVRELQGAFNLIALSRNRRSER